MPIALENYEWQVKTATARGVANAVSQAIRDGVLVAGMKLPPIRAMARQLDMSPTTISAAWSMLARSGTIRTEGRRGTTVAEIRSGSARYRQALEKQATFELDLSTGIPDPHLLPRLGNALKGLTAATPGSYLDDPILPGLLEELRADWPYEAEEFAIVDGAMDALDLVMRSLIGFEDRVIVENPTFPLLLDLIEGTGADVIGVPVDDEGLIPAALAEALETAATAVILQPRAQNPTGASLGLVRAEQLAKIVRASGVIVIEDDSAGSVSMAAPVSLGRWVPDQVLHVRSFSKSHGPDIRLAALSGPIELMRGINARRQLGQGWSSRILQRILLGLLTDQQSINEVTHAREEYQRRRDAMVAALAERGVRVQGSDGVNIWVPVVDELAAVVRLASQGIGVTPGTPFAVLPDQQHHIRITVATIAEHHAELAEQIALASRTGGWRQGRL
jgi:DNA-binding transcriptional MocR family regulator